jgi:aspartate kinase
MSIIVQKFGGTSVRTPESRNALLKKVKSEIENGHEVVVVVSAMGRSGEPYATDTLIKLLNDISPNVSPKKKDLIMSCGEIISCSIISHLLEINGIPSEALTGFQAGILTNGEYNHSDINFVNTSNILHAIKEGKVPVIAGFQGTTSNLEITTLGRGGSDTSAVIIGGYLNAERVDIFTDVKGVAQIDPRIIPEAKYISSISYDDMLKLSINGAKVIHPRAVYASKSFNIPVTVKSTFLDDSGTLINGNASSTEEFKEDSFLGITLQKDLLGCKMPKENKYYNPIKELSVHFETENSNFKFYIPKESMDIVDKFMDVEINFDEIVYGKVSAFFTNSILEEVRIRMKKLTDSYSGDLFDVSWTENSMSVIIDSTEINEFAKKLYEIININ